MGAHHGKPSPQASDGAALIAQYPNHYHLGANGRDAWQAAQSELLENGLDLLSPSSMEGCQIIGANRIDGASLSNCRVGPHVCAMRGSAIMDGSTVERSVLMEGAKVGRGCTVRNCLLGPGAEVADGRSLHGEVLVGPPHNS